MSRAGTQAMETSHAWWMAGFSLMNARGEAVTRLSREGLAHAVRLGASPTWQRRRGFHVGPLAEIGVCSVDAVIG
jgi:hypothetical protein